ncbi:MAG TPA: DUF4082 domain-containing protein [Terriglobales bacterium]|nr:DUF4082 domain-containing protein [Terriglobales bacterium]
MFVLLTAGSSSAQLPVSIFGTSTPGVADGGDAQSVVLGVKIFADVPGQVLGCSFYKSATNTGNHVVSLWDSTGRLLASQSATSETASGKQLVVFSSPVAIAANQVFTCGYFAPAGHFSNDKNSFTVQANVPPLHVPVNGGVFVYGIQPTHWPTSTWAASNYWVDVLFVPANQTQNWISGIKVSPASNAANISWSTAVPADSQVEYGPTALYGSITTLGAARVLAHVVAVGGLLAATTYHFRVRCRDSAGVLVVSADSTLMTAQDVSVLTVSPGPVLTVSPMSLSFAGQAGGPAVTPASLSVTNSGTGSLTYSGTSDQHWLLLSSASGTAPSTLQISTALTGLQAGNYSGYVTVNGGGVTKVVAVALVLKPAPVPHSVALFWSPSLDSHVVSYSMYRSTISGSSYGLSASAISGLTFIDQSVEPGTRYYYVVTAVDDQGRRVRTRMRRSPRSHEHSPLRRAIRRCKVHIDIRQFSVYFLLL